MNIVALEHSKSPIQLIGSDGVVESILLFGKPCDVVQKVRHGAKSIVYLCANHGKLPNLPDKFAVKRMHFDLQDEIAAVAELEMTRNLHSAFVVSVLDGEIARTRGKLCVSLVLEYCPDTLLHVMRSHESRKKRFPEDFVWHLTCCLTAALTFLHAQDPPVAHRDVKVENVLIGADGSFKLSDFGSATTSAYQCTTSADVGIASEAIENLTTIAYRSPEMVDPWQKHRMDEQCDIWSLGVVLYYVMYFKFPFEATKLAILNGKLEFEANGQYSEALKDVVRRCLERDPRKRWSSFDIVAHLKNDPAVRSKHDCSKFPFEIESKPPNWVPQPLANLATRRVCPTVTDASSHGSTALFSMLKWERTSNNTTPSVSPENSEPAPAPPAATSTKALDDLFSWDSTAPPPQPSTGALDRFFTSS